MPQASDLPQSVIHFDSLPDSAHVDVKTVAILAGRGLASVWRDVDSGALPKPKHLGKRSTRWNVGELRRALGLVAAA